MDSTVEELPEDDPFRNAWYQVRSVTVAWNIYTVEAHGCTVYESDTIYIPPDVWRNADDELRTAVNFLLGKNFKLGNPPKTFIYWIPYFPVIGWLLGFAPTRLKKYFCTYLDWKHTLIYAIFQGFCLWIFMSTIWKWTLK